MFNPDGKCTSFRDHLTRLQSNSEILKINAAISGDLEMAALTRRCYRSNPAVPPLFFTSVADSKWKILANLFGTNQRCAQLATATQYTSLSLCSNNLPEHIKSLASFGDWLHSSPKLQPCSAKSLPMRGLSGLYALPRLKIWPEDAGAYLSMAVVIWRSINAERVGCGLYRVQIHSDSQASIHWSTGSDGAQEYAQYQQAGMEMPVAIVLGCEPAFTFAAALPLSGEIDEYMFAAFMQQLPMQIVASEVQGLPVPCQCEFILEGVVRPQGTLIDGPFGNHQGFYSHPGHCPIFDLKRASAREQAIFPVSIIGPPPSESSAIGSCFADFYLPLLRREIDQLLDIYMPEETFFHGCALISLRVDSMLEQVKTRIRSSILLRNSKLLIYVDADIDVRQPQQVFWRVINQLRPDLIQHSGATMEIDTTKWHQEQRRLLCPDLHIEQLLDARWGEYGLDSSYTTKER